MKRVSKYCERAFARLTSEMLSSFPNRKWRVWIDEGGERGYQLAVSGEDVPLEVYKIMERVLTDRRHPYVDFGWGADDGGRHVTDRFGEGRTEWFDYYRTADQQIEIEQSMDDACVQLKRTRKEVRDSLEVLFPCTVTIKKDADERTVQIAVFVKKEDFERLTATEKEMVQRVHQIVGGYLYGDGNNEFDLSTDISERKGKVLFVSTATLCGRRPFSNPLFRAIERERKAFAVVKRNRKPAKDSAKCRSRELSKSVK